MRAGIVFAMQCVVVLCAMRCWSDLVYLDAPVVGFITRLGREYEHDAKHQLLAPIWADR